MPMLRVYHMYVQCLYMQEGPAESFRNVMSTTVSTKVFWLHGRDVDLLQL
jgi:hypothetical protein